jgi:hypothetical protein
MLRMFTESGAAMVVIEVWGLMVGENATDFVGVVLARSRSDLKPRSDSAVRSRTGGRTMADRITWQTTLPRQIFQETDALTAKSRQLTNVRRHL